MYENDRPDLERDPTMTCRRQPRALLGTIGWHSWLAGVSIAVTRGVERAGQDAAVEEAAAAAAAGARCGAP
jgi:hypothetical protein